MEGRGLEVRKRGSEKQLKKRQKRSKQEGWNEREKEGARTIGGKRRFGYRLKEKQGGKLSFFLAKRKGTDL